MRSFFLILCFMIFSPCFNLAYPEMDQEREQMVRNQIERRGIKNRRVLSALREVQRHQFVPAELHTLAYMDQPLPIGEEQTISQPYIVALMTELLELRPEDKVLEIGTGSGYQAAVLSKMAKEVYTIEIIPDLAKKAEKRLRELGYQNVFVKTGDGSLGWPEHAPFDAIIVTAAPDDIPKPLIDQLKIDGRLVIPIGNDPSQMLYLAEKTERGLIKKEIVPVRFVPMVEQSKVVDPDRKIG